MCQRILDLLSLLQTRARIAAVKREMAELAQEGADERHVENLALGDEMVVHANRSHEHEHIGVAGVVADQHVRTVGGEVFAPSYLRAAADQREIRAKQPMR